MDAFQEVLTGTNFTGIDWGIVAAYLLISVVVGVFANRYVGDMADYVVAGRGIRTALGIATLTGTELGLVTVMYSAQKGFTGGFAAFHIALLVAGVTLVVGLTGFIIGALRRHEVLTISEFYGKRFGKDVQIAGGLVLAFAGILNMGMFLRAGSIFIVGITGLPLTGGALFWIMLALLALVLFYTILGGMVSVVLTDYIQFVVLSFGLLLATGLALWHFGWSDLVAQVTELKGEGGFNPLLEESGFGPSYAMWQLFLGLVSCAIWPAAVSRALAAKDERTVRRQFTLSAFSLSIRFLIPYFWGVCAFVLITQTPELNAVFFPAGGGAEGADSLYAMPVFLGRLLPAGLIGLITAAMIAAFMSTHDSYFLCWSSVLTNDVVLPLAGGNLSQRTQVWIARAFILVIGVAIFTISFAYPLSEDLWDYLGISGAIYSTGAVALLGAGLYWKRASRAGAYGALFAGMLSVFGLSAVSQGVFVGLFGWDAAWVEANFTVARVGLGAVALAFVLMIAGSLLFPHCDKEAAA